MFGVIAAFTGGVIKDVQVGISNTYDYLADEVASIPDAFSAGYTHGIMSAPDEDPYSITDESISQKHA